MATIGEHSASFEELDNEDSLATVEDLGNAVLSAGNRGAAKPLSRNLADKLSAVEGPNAAYDDRGDEEKEDEQSSKAARSSDVPTFHFLKWTT
ncbi:hypothetical protein PC128_g17266 [Phytophthora cactorum]|nr:hypothetical protein PC128_g17266 [Phytophthora cactorum]KAG4058002.1 hypothetical protein PC123_g7010 [Phytophthora cactorum]